MENKFYTDHFEQFLKETVDDFRMYPSKRVWNSIYNNIHPGRKWPSLATCLLVAFSLVIYSASNQTHPTVQIGNTSTTNSYPQNNLHLASVLKPAATQQVVSNTAFPAQQHFTAVNATPSATGTINDQAVGNNFVSRDEVVSAQGNKSGLYTTSRSSLQIGNAAMGIDASSTEDISNGSLMARYGSPAFTSAADGQAQLVSIVRKPLVKKRTVTSFTDKEWMEDFAFHNKPTEKWKGRLAYQLYATPSVGYRSMSKNSSQEIPTSSLTPPPGTNSNRAEDHGFTHAPSWNLEAGGAFLLSVSKSLRVKAGMQLNYTRYMIEADAIGHPVFSTLLLNNEQGNVELAARSSSFANVASGNDGNNRLNNSTYQISLPIGADFKIAGSEKFQWYAGATIQPTFVVGGNPYLLSADSKNYIYDVSLMRRWNLNTSVETFISYQLGNGAVLNAGPQFRYQLLSTYDKRYTYDEKLYNIGLKLGITRNF